jgi:hypothetical protein
MAPEGPDEMPREQSEEFGYDEARYGIRPQRYLQTAAVKCPQWVMSSS